MVASQLSIKSAQNINASSMLIENNLHASSVHCSYYGMFQFMTCKLSHAKEISFDTIRINAKGPGSHNYVISEIIDFLKEKELSTALNEIQKNVVRTNLQKLKGRINDLKNSRKQSDYFDFQVDAVLSTRSLESSKKIITDLKKYIP